MSSSTNSSKITFLIPVVGILVAVISIEGAFRLLSSLASPRPIWSDRPIGYLMPQNSITLQDESRAPKQRDTFRISVVGDSFTFGPNMQLDDTFPKRLGRMLQLQSKTKNSQPNQIEVLNRGFSGYGTAQQVDEVKREAVEGADLIIHEITLNDAEPHMLSEKEKRKLFDAPHLRAPIFKVWSSLGFLLSRLQNSKTHSIYIDYHSKFFKEPESFERFKSSLQQMRDITQSNKIKFALLLFPLFDFKFDARYPLADVHQIIATAAQELQIPLLDLRGAYTYIPQERLQVIPGVDSHPNEIAHRIAAERLLAFLAQKHLVPEQFLPTTVYPQRRAIRTKPTTSNRVFELSLKPLENLDFKVRRKRKEK